MLTVDFKLQSKYYSVYKESGRYVLTENIHNLGVVYETIEQFESEADLKNYMLNMEKESNHVFERI